MADWLDGRGLFVCHERPMLSQLASGVFTVTDVERGRRVRTSWSRGDCCRWAYATQFRGCSVKPGNKHGNTLDGFDTVLGYFVDYACGAGYEVDGSQVDASAIVVLVTSFGPKGYLF